MNLYLTRHQYKNTFTEDLWAALEESSQKPVAAVMSTWTKQMGFPVVRVSAKQEAKSTVLTLSQERFCADGNRQSKFYSVNSADPGTFFYLVILNISFIFNFSPRSFLVKIKKEQWLKSKKKNLFFFILTKSGLTEKDKLALICILESCGRPHLNQPFFCLIA